MQRRDEGVRMFGTLADDQRRRIYDFVAGRRARTSRDEVAEALGIARTLAAFHLDKLADRGLLTVTFAASPGGPGRARDAPRSCTNAAASRSSRACRSGVTSWRGRCSRRRSRARGPARRPVTRRCASRASEAAR